jgi:hypothetical protein
MGQRVELTPKQEREYLALREAKTEGFTIIGQCEGCKRDIPAGYIIRSTKVRIERHGWFIKRIPVDLWCKECWGPNVLSQAKREKTQTIQKKKPWLEAGRIVLEEAQELTKKEIAIKLLTVLTDQEPMGSKKMAKLAEIEYSDRIIEVLQILRRAGKVTFEEGRWSRG